MTDLFQTSGSSPTNRTKTEPDFILDGSGSVYLLRPRNESALPNAAIQRVATEYLRQLDADAGFEVIDLPLSGILYDEQEVEQATKTFLEEHLRSTLQSQQRSRTGRQRNFRVLDKAEPCEFCGRIRQIFIGGGCVKCWAGPTERVVLQ